MFKKYNIFYLYQYHWVIMGKSGAFSNVLKASGEIVLYSAKLTLLVSNIILDKKIECQSGM